VCEVEWDLLELLAGHDSLDSLVVRSAPASTPARPTVHDAPSAAELLEAVHEFLVSDVMTATDGRLRFHARVAGNVVAMVGRQLAVGEAQDVEHGRRLGRLGVGDDAELANAIRAGLLEDRTDEVFAIVVAAVAAKLEVAHPGYGGSPVAT
jgi:hypothetical protein